MLEICHKKILIKKNVSIPTIMFTITFKAMTLQDSIKKTQKSIFSFVSDSLFLGIIKDTVTLAHSALNSLFL